MTAIFYPDQEISSPDRRFRLEARSPHNGTINFRDGRAPSGEDYAFKYKDHQDNFRYQLLDAFTEEALWTRWQMKGEDSPHQLLLSNDGWSILRTHGFRPELIAISPTGVDTIRIKIRGDRSEEEASDPAPRTPTFEFRTDALSFTTAGKFWSGNSWQYFLNSRGKHYVVWRTYLGERIVLDLDRAKLLSSAETEDPELVRVMVAEEMRGATEVLHELSNRIEEIKSFLRTKDDPIPDLSLRKKLAQAPAALNLVCTHRILECASYARTLDQIDLSHSSTSSHGLTEWSIVTQFLRPLAQHALKLLDIVPDGYPTYHFTHRRDESRFPLAECIRNRRDQSRSLDKSMSGEQVLNLLGSPDFVSRASRRIGRYYRWSETWEYDFRAPESWLTLKVTFEEEKGKSLIVNISENVSPWLSDSSRLNQILDHWY